MKKLIFILPIFLSGCLYINHDVGTTTFQYDRCKKYYDANGTYHKECPKSIIEKSEDKVTEVTKCLAKKTKDFFYSFSKKECKNRQIVEK